MPELIRVRAERVIDRHGLSQGTLVLSCSDKRIQPKIVHGVTSYKELEAELRIFKDEISAILLDVNFDEKKFNAYAVMQEMASEKQKQLKSSLIEQKKEPEFEMNLTEALVG